MDYENEKPEAQLQEVSTPFTDDEIHLLCQEVSAALSDIRHLLDTHLNYLKGPKRHCWLTSYEVQNYLRISKLTLKRYRETRQIRFIFFMGRFRYHYDDVKKMLERLPGCRLNS